MTSKMKSKKNTPSLLWKLALILHLGWFTRAWWNYLLETPRDPSYTTWWKRFWCRAYGHPNGQIYYNVTGTEPDDRCIDCHDYI